MRKMAVVLVRFDPRIYWYPPAVHLLKLICWKHVILISVRI